MKALVYHGPGEPPWEKRPRPEVQDATDAESFRGEAHLRRIAKEAQAIVDGALANGALEADTIVGPPRGLAP